MSAAGLSNYAFFISSSQRAPSGGGNCGVIVKNVRLRPLARDGRRRNERRRVQAAAPLFMERRRRERRRRDGGRPRADQTLRSVRREGAE